MKSFHIIKRFACVIFILTAVCLAYAGTGNSPTPVGSSNRDMHHFQSAGTEKQDRIYAGRHAINERDMEHTVPPGRVLIHQVLNLFQGELAPGSWIPDLYMPQNIYSMMFCGGIFLLFLFWASMPGQFYDKLNITHESDGKKRPL